MACHMVAMTSSGKQTHSDFPALLAHAFLERLPALLMYMSSWLPAQHKGLSAFDCLFGSDLRM